MRWLGREGSRAGVGSLWECVEQQPTDSYAPEMVCRLPTAESCAEIPLHAACKSLGWWNLTLDVIHLAVAGPWTHVVQVHEGRAG